ncbi:MAG: HAD hydrolase-like protein [Candidatus Moranbacteria bacterium]|nr:HAD hydrolase-like protein [Candidatus Moranbacteria bacterium]
MKIFLDFDDCLFDTNAFYIDLQGIFEANGVSKELFQRAYQEIKNESQIDGAWCYSFEKHVRRLRNYVFFDEGDLHQKLATYISDTKKFLFPDVEKFLIVLRESASRIYILSFGDRDHQMGKISGTGILSYIEKSIITNKDKSEAFQDEIDHEEDGVWFFDDRIKYIESVKRAFPKVKTILVRRVEGRYHDEPNEFCDYVVSDLDEALAIIKNLA